MSSHPARKAKTKKKKKNQKIRTKRRVNARTAQTLRVIEADQLIIYTMICDFFFFFLSP